MKLMRYRRKYEKLAERTSDVGAAIEWLMPAVMIFYAVFLVGIIYHDYTHPSPKKNATINLSTTAMRNRN